MQTEFYKSYVDELRNTLQHGTKRGELRKANSINGIKDGTRFYSNVPMKMALSAERDQKLFESLQPLNSISGKKVNYHLKPGAHPDFDNLKDETSFENHYIISIFIDVKNSTNLFRRYNPETVANIINVIQRAAVHTVWYFDGYIQRYHGDGLFAYFGGKSVSKKEATNNALTATSFINYFMKNDLKKLFNEQGIENIYARIGIDLGDDEDVLWYKAGMGDCSEITTCSLHTSLASKMQSAASNNGIVVGNNIKSNSTVSEEFFEHVRDTSGKVDSYAFQIPDESFYYKQWDFNWTKYLKSLPQITEDAEGNLFIKDKEQVEKERIQKLMGTAQLINTGNAFTDRSGNISSAATGIKNQDHRFHYEQPIL